MISYLNIFLFTIHVAMKLLFKPLLIATKLHNLYVIKHFTFFADYYYYAYAPYARVAFEYLICMHAILIFVFNIIINFIIII